VVSDETHGLGVAFIDPVAIEYDRTIAAAYVLDAGLPAILRVDPMSGNRTEVIAFSSAFAFATDFVLDPGEPRFLATTSDPPALWDVRVAQQSTTLVSGAGRGSGPQFGLPAGVMGFTSPTVGSVPSTPLAIVADAARGALVLVNTVDGERVILSK
jgi:hypothetical protein